MLVAVDWDGTCVPAGLYPAQPRAWMPGAVEALDELACHCKVVIFSARLNGAGLEARSHRVYIRGMLNAAGLHHVDLHDNREGKPSADLFIDDRGLHFVDWNNSMPQIWERLGV